MKEINDKDLRINLFLFNTPSIVLVLFFVFEVVFIDGIKWDFHNKLRVGSKWFQLFYGIISDARKPTRDSQVPDTSSPCHQNKKACNC